jgi:60 kDa SS-A/Ro ribonucleoprotein
VDKHFVSLFTPQKEQARKDQAPNSAGGYAFPLDKWARLDRWLVLGAEGGTYYASERVLTRENATTIAECLAENGLRTVARIVSVSETGRAPKNETAIFALALAAGDVNPETRKAALAAVPRVCRTGTDLFHFVRDVEGFRKWGRGLRNAIASWYNDKPVERVAYQAIKYRQRDGWSHKDLLRLAHPKAPTPQHDALYRFILGGEEALSKETPRGKAIDPANLPAFVRAFGSLERATERREVVSLIRDHRFTHEMLRTEWKNDPEVWAALLADMPQGAMIRNLGKMTSVGVLGPMSDASQARGAAPRGQGPSRARPHPPDRRALRPPGVRAGPR